MLPENKNLLSTYNPLFPERLRNPIKIMVEKDL
jgi:hypothetical protein